MKEAVVYDMYRYLDTDASLYNYAKISLNGEYWGVYLALEAVEESFLLRNYGTQDGKLYKPDSMDMGGNADRKALPEGQEPPDGQMPPQAQELPEGQMPQEVQGLRSRKVIQEQLYLQSAVRKMGKLLMALKKTGQECLREEAFL